MRRFCQSTKADYEELDMILSDGQLHVFNNRELPLGCNPRKLELASRKMGIFIHFMWTLEWKQVLTMRTLFFC